MYIDLNSNRLEYDDGYCADGYCGDVYAASETSGAAMRKKKRIGKEGAKLLATDGEWELWQPTTWEASIYLAGLGGQKATWVNAYSGDDRWFRYYADKGPFYVFINKSNPAEKYQSHPATKSWFFDAKDRNLGEQALIDFLDEHPAFADFFEVEDDVEACGDINASTNIDAAVKSKYDSVRKLLGEDEWYYIEEYIINGDGKHSLEDIIFDENAWDDYCDWKMKNFGKKAALSAATRIMAKKILASTRI